MSSQLFPESLKQFGMGRLLAAMTSIAVASALSKMSPIIGFLPLAAVMAYWVSITFFHFSDRIDERPVDDRGLVSWWLNNFGLLSALLAFIAGIIAVFRIGLSALATILRP